MKSREMTQEERLGRFRNALSNMILSKKHKVALIKEGKAFAFDGKIAEVMRCSFEQQANDLTELLRIFDAYFKTERGE